MTAPAPPPPDPERLAAARRLLRRALLALLLPGLGAGTWTAALAFDGHAAAALGLGLGAGSGLAVGLSWLLSAFRQQGAGGATIWPLRLAGVAGILLLALTARADPTWLVGALCASVVYAQVVTVVTLCSPAASTDPPAPGRPASPADDQPHR